MLSLGFTYCDKSHPSQRYNETCQCNPWTSCLTMANRWGEWRLKKFLDNVKLAVKNCVYFGNLTGICNRMLQLQHPYIIFVSPGVVARMRDFDGYGDVDWISTIVVVRDIEFSKSSKVQLAGDAMSRGKDVLGRNQTSSALPHRCRGIPMVSVPKNSHPGPSSCGYREINFQMLCR